MLDALHYGDANGNGLTEFSELVAQVQSVVPKVAKGVVLRSAVARGEPTRRAQSARFGSRGEDFAIAQRLR